MKKSYQSKPIPLFTHYNDEYSKLQLKLRFHFPALHRQTRQAAHSFRRNDCAHHTLGNSFFFYPLYFTWCKMRSHFLAFLSQDRPLSPYNKPEPMMSRAPLSLPFTFACYSSTPTVLRYIRKDRCSRNVIDITISFTRIHISSSFSILFFSSDQASTDCKILFETLPIQLHGKKR